MNAISRRALMRTGSLAMPTALLGACTISSSGGTHTATLDVAKITTDGQAIIASATAVLAAPAVTVLLGANAATAAAALAAANAALVEINSLTGGSITVSVDTTKVQTLVSTLLANARTVLSLVQGITAQLTGTVATTIGNYVAAGLALIPFVSLAAGFASAMPTAGGMTEAQARAVVGM